MHRLLDFWRQKDGGAAIEMAIVTPVVVGLALVSAEVWMMAMDKQRAATALDAGSDYYMGGGSSDDEAISVALAAWQDQPESGTVSLVRSARCGVEASDLSATCPDGSAPAVYVTLAAHAVSRGLFEARDVDAERTVRVR